eukprot:g13840.t1
MGKSPAAKAGKSPIPPTEPPEEELVDEGLDFLEAKCEQEEAVCEAVEAVLRGVLGCIGGDQLKEIIHDHTAAVVTDDIAQIYATVDISAPRHGGPGRRRSPHGNKEDETGVPFAIAPEVREDQSLPPWIPVKGNKARKGGKGGGRGGGRRGNRSGVDKGRGRRNSGSEDGNRQEGDADNSSQDDDASRRVEELGGREWTTDGSGALLLVDRPKGDAMPKTVVSALYNFRDVKDKEDGAAEDTQNQAGGDGGRDGDGARGRRKRSSGSAGTSTSENNQSGSAMRRPGAGVSVSDGNSFKEGPSWPRDPDHMSRSEYQERQRAQDLSDTNTLDCGEDASTLGFSLGSVKSAPALGGLGLGQRGVGGVGVAGSGAESWGGRRAVSGGGGGGGGGSRGTSISAFETVNPFAGGVRVATSTAQNSGGDLSPLSASVEGQNGSKFFSGAGPETSSVGDDDDPHLALLKDPDWGRNVGGPRKEAGHLPKVKNAETLGNSLVRTVTEEGEFSWEKCLAASTQKLLVVDCHQDWCGRCETLQPTFQRIALETTDNENRCQFLEANLDKFADRVQALLPKDSPVNLATQGCMPLIVLIKGGVAVASISGCDAPAILREVTKHMPPERTSDDKDTEPE